MGCGKDVTIWRRSRLHLGEGEVGAGSRLALTLMLMVKAYAKLGQTLESLV